MPFYSLLRCPLCRVAASSAQGCCDACAETLFNPKIAAFDLSLGVYESRLERAVRAFKFGGTRRLHRLFGARLAAEVQRAAWPLELLCPVPLHPLRHLARGYNQSALIARCAAQALALPYRPVLRRVRVTRQQARLGAEARQHNLSGAFWSAPLSGERVLLVDDVTTSGATATECALALLRAGAAQVYVGTVARAARD